MSKDPSTKKPKWLKDLQSPKQEVVLSTVISIAKTGDLSMVQPLLDCYARNEVLPIRMAITNTLGDVKDEGLGDILFEALQNLANGSIRSTILSIVWNASVPLQGRLETLTQLACTGDFDEQFEVITALDNYADEFDEEEVINSLMDMREFLRKQGGGTPLQLQILQKLEIIERFD